jgi:uncharacterized protein (DUF1499 family)
MLRRLRRWLARALGLAVIAGFAVISLSGHDPARWHIDPASLTLRGSPNEFLAAVPGATKAVPHARAPVYSESPRALLARFDAIALAQSRTKRIAGDPDSLMITYVQRSRIIGFPDYITVKAIAPEASQETGLPEGGAGLIVYSRSRYGQGDFGVNRSRVEAWLAALEKGR